MRVCLPFNALLVTNTYPICTDLISRFNHITLFEMAWEAEFKHSLLILKLHKTLKDTAHKSEENAYMVTNIKTKQLWYPITYYLVTCQKQRL